MTRSYSHRAWATSLLNDTLGGSLDKAAARWPDREAVVIRDQDIRLTFAELCREADRLAVGLIALGLQPGDRVGLWSPNNIEWVLTQYATAKAGLILVNLNPAYRAGELEYALNQVECRALITADQFKSSDYIRMLRELAPELADCAPGALRSGRFPHLTTVIQISDTDEPGFYNLDSVRRLGARAEFARLAELTSLLQPDDPINIQFTSGSTGLPKAATLTHHGLLNNGFFFGEVAGVREGDRFCNPLPLYHVGAMVLGSICGVAHGLTIVYLGQAFDPLAALDAIQAEGCQAFGGVPTMFVSILNHPSFAQYDLSSLRLGFIGGSPCPIDVMLAEYAVLSEEALVQVPSHLSSEEAATLPCAAVTAWVALTRDRRVTAGDTVLTQGSGGVSIFALQFARILGARVIATTSTAEKADRLRALGASEVINYTETPNWDEKVLELTNDRGVDCVVEIGGPGTIAMSLKALAVGGHLSLIGASLSNSGAGLDPLLLTGRGITLGAISVGSRVDFEAMNRAIAMHRLHPVIDRAFPFAEAKEAYRHFEGRGHFGKVVITHG